MALLAKEVSDPCPKVSPITLQPRKIFQQFCQLEKSWDEPLPMELEEQWGQWVADLPEIKKFKILRSIKPIDTPVKNAQLHHFADATKYGNGTASCLRVVLKDNSVHASLIMAKLHLTPLKESTILRLELAGALEAVQLEKKLSIELQIPLDT
ncbi:uncharacterized protein [Palaemon carinicauda]|uniref:uncharacterized protein n=1 Tax=Palaemon carinicauda TaxID=392227 RepID=UPI0035B69C54